VESLKAEGKQIVATHLSTDSKPISEIDFTKPTALVLGNEKDGISPEMASLADHRVVLPMNGFVQSYNISVAGALSFYHIYQDRLRRQGRHGDLTAEQQDILRALYSLRTMDSAGDILRRLAQS
jgi:tRNA (guanosine-2'-O-)-methyltransferase